MSAYFDLRSELFRQVFRDALAYPEYLATGNSREAAAWARADAALPALPDDARTRLDAGRPHRERALPQRHLVRGLRSVGSDRGPARRGGGAVR